MFSTFFRVLPLLFVGFVSLTFADDFLRRLQIDELAATRAEKEYIEANTPTWLLIQLAEISLVWIISIFLGNPIGDAPICFATSFLIVLTFRSWGNWRENHDGEAIQKIRDSIDREAKRK
jgi:Na+/H+ antiporter NhaD/arsenite permease-like protein